MASNLTIIDVDGVAGYESLYALAKDTGISVPDVPTVITSKGRHLYFAYTPGLNNRVGIRPGLDLRTSGAFVVGPGSIHASGHRYIWHTDSSIAQRDRVPIPPEWLKALTTSAKERAPELAFNEECASDYKEGERNDRLYGLAARMARAGVGKVELAAAIRGINRSLCSPPLLDGEVEQLVLSAARVATLKIAPHVITTEELRVLSSRPANSLPVLGTPGHSLAGKCHLLAGHPKCGKTTLVFEMMAEWTDQRILFITADESAVTLKDRLDLYPGTSFDHVKWLVLGSPDKDAVVDAISGNYDCVVVDTLRTVFGMEEENSNSGVTRELMPIVSACRSTGTTLVLLHHLRKAADGMSVRAVSGASNLTGMVDIVMLLGAVRGGRAGVLQLVSEGRGLERSELKLTLTGGRIRHGSPEMRLLALISPSGTTLEELRKRADMSFTTLPIALDSLIEQKLVSVASVRNPETGRGARVYTRLNGTVSTPVDEAFSKSGVER